MPIPTTFVSVLLVFGMSASFPCFLAMAAHFETMADAHRSSASAISRRVRRLSSAQVSAPIPRGMLGHSLDSEEGQTFASFLRDANTKL